MALPVVLVVLAEAALDRQQMEQERLEQQIRAVAVVLDMVGVTVVM